MCCLGSSESQLQKCTHVERLVLFEPAAKDLQIDIGASVDGSALQGGCRTAPIPGQFKKELFQSIAIGTIEAALTTASRPVTWLLMKELA